MYAVAPMPLVWSLLFRIAHLTHCNCGSSEIIDKENSCFSTFPNYTWFTDSFCLFSAFCSTDCVVHVFNAAILFNLFYFLLCIESTLMWHLCEALFFLQNGDTAVNQFCSTSFSKKVLNHHPVKHGLNYGLLPIEHFKV